ncbi:MAG: N-acetylmuramoyl-L-alanine amidase AmiB, partial [Chloroflexota bacterium]
MKRSSRLIQTALILALMCALVPSAAVVVRAAPAAEIIYTVQRGDTLSAIAARYGVTVAALQQVNGLGGTVIVLGQRLIVPETAAVAAAAPGAQFRYVVQRGDTLFRLAQAYGTSVLGIQRASGITGTRLEIGDVLQIPGTGAVAVAVGVVATLKPAEGVSGAKTEVTVTLTPTPGKGLNTSTPAPVQISSRNLLTNADFEGSAVKYKDSIDQQVATAWQPWWLNNANCTNQVPKYSVANASMLPGRVYAGYKAQLVSVSGGSSFEGGLSQTVTGIAIGSRIRFSVWGSAWSSSGVDQDVSLGAGSINMRVGIADGLVDAASPNIVWSRYKNYIDTYGQLSVEFVAAATSVTVFTSAYPSLCLTNNQVFWDEAAVTSVISTRYASLNDLVGTVEMRKSISGFGAAGDGQDLGVGSQVRTGPDSRARVQLTEGTIISMDENTTLTLAALGQDLAAPFTRLQLTGGRIWVMHPAGTVDIETKSGNASVQGGMLS